MPSKKKSRRGVSGNPAKRSSQPPARVVSRLVAVEADLNATYGLTGATGPLPAALTQVPWCDLCGAPVIWMGQAEAMHYALHDPATVRIVMSDGNMLADVWTCSKSRDGCVGGATLLHTLMPA